MSSNDILSPPAGSVKTNPFLSSPSEPTVAGSTPSANQKIMELFNTSASSVPEKNGNESTTPIRNDLLCLNNMSGNPFADSLFSNEPPGSQQQQDQTFATFTNGKCFKIWTSFLIFHLDGLVSFDLKDLTL